MQYSEHPVRDVAGKILTPFTSRWRVIVIVLLVLIASLSLIRGMALAYVSTSFHTYDDAFVDGITLAPEAWNLVPEREGRNRQGISGMFEDAYANAETFAFLDVLSTLDIKDAVELRQILSIFRSAADPDAFPKSRNGVSDARTDAKNRFLKLINEAEDSEIIAFAHYVLGVAALEDAVNDPENIQQYLTTAQDELRASLVPTFVMSTWQTDSAELLEFVIRLIQTSVSEQPAQGTGEKDEGAGTYDPGFGY